MVLDSFPFNRKGQLYSLAVSMVFVLTFSAVENSNSDLVFEASAATTTGSSTNNT